MSPHQLNMTSISVADVMLEIWKRLAPIVCVKSLETILQFLDASGDIANEKDDYTLSNSVYNSLKRHSMKEQKYGHKLHEKKEHSTQVSWMCWRTSVKWSCLQEQTLDPKTRLILFKLVDGGLLEDVNGCINTGKEANVYHATGGRLAWSWCSCGIQ